MDESDISTGISEPNPRSMVSFDIFEMVVEETEKTISHLEILRKDEENRTTEENGISKSSSIENEILAELTWLEKYTGMLKNDVKQEFVQLKLTVAKETFIDVVEKVGERFDKIIGSEEE